ncbi:hypothetical protein ABRZ80_20610 [Vibrio vulnificus]|uniref:hypothetical protein n=1 Tax=Vibrio vulnificus TaxID=672 RepID=UPI0032EDF0FC
MLEQIKKLFISPKSEDVLRHANSISVTPNRNETVALMQLDKNGNLHIKGLAKFNGQWIQLTPQSKKPIEFTHWVYYSKLMKI